MPLGFPSDILQGSLGVDQFAATILFRLMAMLGLSLIFVPLEFVVRFIQAKPIPKCAGVPAINKLGEISYPLVRAPGAKVDLAEGGEAGA